MELCKRQHHALVLKTIITLERRSRLATQACLCKKDNTDTCMYERRRRTFTEEVNRRGLQASALAVFVVQAWYFLEGFGLGRILYTLGSVVIRYQKGIASFYWNFLLEKG